MKTNDEMRDARRYRVELILLGMLLAKDGDRAKILKEVSYLDIKQPRVSDCVLAIANSDGRQIRDAFSAWGIELSGSCIDSLIKYIDRANTEDRAQLWVEQVLKKAGPDAVLRAMKNVTLTDTQEKNG